MMACTATVTRDIRQEVMHSLEMLECEFVTTSPNRPNIFYEVHSRTDVETDLKFAIDSLMQGTEEEGPSCHSVLPFVGHVC